MPRNGSGLYSLPESPFVAGTVILSADMNSDLDDIADALTASLAADGQTPITAPLLFPPGTASLPGIAFLGDADTGLYRISSNVVGMTVGGVLLQSWSSGAAGIDGTLTVSSSATIGNNIVLNAGVYSAPAGTAAAPSYSFAGELDSGLYLIGANNIGVALNGAKVLDILTTGLSVTGLVTASTGFKVGANPTATPGKTPTTQEFLSSSGNYTPTAGAVWIRARWIAGGGGGAGTGGAAGSGGASSFNGIIANGGAPGVNGSGSTGGIGGAGGSGGAGTANLRLPGKRGGDGGFSSNSSSGNGGEGGDGPFGGGGASSNTTGRNAETSSGGGGSGAGNNGFGSGGGGCGEYCEAILPAAVYAFVVGAGGTPATNGGAGAAGRIIVEEFYS